MGEPNEVVIVVGSPAPDRTREVFTWTRAGRRALRTGLRAGPSAEDIDRKVLELKHSIERGGGHVTVKFL